MPPKNKTLPWLLKAITVETDECIVWPFRTNEDGYGELFYNGKKERAHRVALHLINGFNLSSPLDVLHSCDNEPCVNKRHISAGTHKKNMRDASSRGRMKKTPRLTCNRGHVLDEANTYVAPSDGRRRCKKCRATATELFKAHETLERQLG